MSLINEALKKAQKQREVTPGTPPPGTPPPASPSGGTPAGSPPPPRRGGYTAVIAAACALVAVSVAVTVYLLRGDRSGPVAAATPPPSANTSSPAQTAAIGKTASPAPSPSAQEAGRIPPTASTEPQPAPPPAQVASNNSGSNAQLDSAPSEVQSTPPATLPVNPPAVAVAANASAPAPATPAMAAPVNAEPNRPSEALSGRSTIRTQAIVDKFRISGIRLSDTDSKVILNEHLFRQNDLVEPSLGLRLVKIEPSVLTFTDAEGTTYLKRF
jgi:hypothetical protein